MSVAKYHHINPRFVLQGFADEGGRIKTVRLPERSSFISLVENTGGENHLNSLPGHPNGSDVFEKALGSGIEAETAELFERVVGGEWPLPKEDRDTLAEFLALQMLRGPEQRRLMQSTAAELFSTAAGQLGREDFARWASDTAGRPLSTAEIDEAWALVLEPDGFALSYTARDHIELMGELTSPVAGFLATRPWTLVHFAEPGLITSDAPVSLVAHEQFGAAMGVGVATARLVLYPMTRTIGLVMRNPLDGRYSTHDLDGLIATSRSGALDDRSSGTQAMRKEFNVRTAANSVRNLYHHPDDSRSVPPAYREKQD
ncbi:DUF4238 domain-containing protein [Leifsonia sp. ZF2019]|uniref:DUF4238 domain-containing protein n=1 Tax=Leifsonia sp. ZF2019 TaxID=2781978 RepID=UPI001CBABD28|nr:DUF4238 domain-containing protein [Leifsonia sp. ZF2019]UAJ78033.1 DUF4238 domain-containing protein [Leifsonia sp. ZF2019]